MLDSATGTNPSATQIEDVEKLTEISILSERGGPNRFSSKSSLKLPQRLQTELLATSPHLQVQLLVAA